MCQWGFAKDLHTGQDSQDPMSKRARTMIEIYVKQPIAPFCKKVETVIKTENPIFLHGLSSNLKTGYLLAVAKYWTDVSHTAAFWNNIHTDSQSEWDNSMREPPPSYKIPSSLDPGTICSTLHRCSKTVLEFSTSLTRNIAEKCPIHHQAVAVLIQVLNDTIGWRAVKNCHSSTLLASPTAISSVLPNPQEGMWGKKIKIENEEQKSNTEDENPTGRKWKDTIWRRKQNKWVKRNEEDAKVTRSKRSKL